MAWGKGTSGNPRGRPAKGRALTELVERVGNRKRETAEGMRANKQMFAEKLWEGLTTGAITFEGRALALSGQEWQALAKLVLSQVDGPPPALVDVTSEGEAVSFSVVEIIKRADAD
jgi:hypothetical protein